MCFEAIFGLKINLGKSELFLVGLGDDVEDLAFEVGCKVGSLSSTCLGLPLGAFFQISGGLGRNRREISKKIGYVEETIHFKGW